MSSVGRTGLWAVLFVACSSTDDVGGRPLDAGTDSSGNDSGGASASDGASASGGAAGGGKSTGGRPASGGSASGGFTATGGASTGGAGGQSATGGTANTGGTATGGTANTGGAATGGNPTCQGQEYAVQSVPVDAYIMFDQSSSMYDPVPAPGTGTWWAGAAAGLTSFVKDPAAAGIGVGLQYFPLGGVAPASCNAAYSTPEVAIAALPGNANALSASIAAHSPTTFTPTGPALAGALAHMKSWASSHAGRTPAVVLVTDGFPTECEPQQIADIATLAKNAFETSPSVRTHVVGLNLGPGKENLNQIAKAGGTDQAFFIDGGTIGASLASALLNAAKGNFSCTFPLPTPQAGPLDLGKVNVTYTAGTQQGTLAQVTSRGSCAANGGQAWYYDNPQTPKQIMLCQQACEQRPSRTYQVVLGCVSVQGR